MRTLKEVASAPSAWDSPKNYMGAPLDEMTEEYVVMTRNRDSDTLTESNWRTALKQLGGESECVTIHRFGHWACGWWEALCVSGEKKAQGEQIEKKIDNYPVLNEEDYSELEQERADEYWKSLSIKERVELCQEYEVCVFAARHDYCPNDEQGELVHRLGN